MVRTTHPRHSPQVTQSNKHMNVPTIAKNILAEDGGKNIPNSPEIMHSRHPNIRAPTAYSAAPMHTKMPVKHEQIILQELSDFALKLARNRTHPMVMLRL